MVKMIALWLLAMYSMYVVEGAVSLVPFITPCHASDSACMKSSAQRAVPMMAAGLPDIGVKPLDPMHLDTVKADQAGLKLEFRKTNVKGLRNCVVMNVKRQNHIINGTTQNTKHTVELKCSVVMIGEYTIGGKLIVMPVEGDGKYKIKIRDFFVKVTYDLITKTVEGKKFWSITSWSYTSDLRGGAEFQFQNLFNGNKQLSDAVHEFANTGWKEIFQEVAPPIIKAIVGKIVDEVKRFFEKVPISDLSLD